MQIEAIPQSEVARLLEGIPINAFIMTDGRGELIGDKIWKVIDHHGNTATYAATDSSHQNGLVERSYRKLKGRLLLYALCY